MNLLLFTKFKIYKYNYFEYFNFIFIIEKLNIYKNKLII